MAFFYGSHVLRGALIAVLWVLLFTRPTHGSTTVEDKAAIQELYCSSNGDQWRLDVQWPIVDYCPVGWCELAACQRRVHGCFVDSSRAECAGLGTPLAGDSCTCETSTPEKLDPCENPAIFRGVRCSGQLGMADRRVTSINLSFMGIGGFLPYFFGALTHLQELFMSSNVISGTIPSSICNMTKVITFDIFSNRLEGQLPPCIGGMVSMKKLDLRSNRLSGTLPLSMCELPVIEELYLSGQRHSSVPGSGIGGTIPNEIGGLTTLRQLHLGYNRLTGTIPASLGDIATARWATVVDNAQEQLFLDLHGNQFCDGMENCPPTPYIVASIGAL